MIRNACTCISCERSRQHYGDVISPMAMPSHQKADNRIPGMNAPPPWAYKGGNLFIHTTPEMERRVTYAVTGEDYGDDIMIGSGGLSARVGHCATVCGFGEVVNHTMCRGTECRDYTPKNTQEGDSPKRTGHTGPARIPSPAPYNPITAIDEREPT